jgi:hypothetical protein
MNKYYKVNISVLIVTSFVLLSISPIVNSIELEESKVDSSEEIIELDLLRGEYYLYINATENVGSFNVRYAFPAELKYQFPIIIEIFNDTTADILNYKIENDTNEPNKIANFTIGGMNKDESALIHFTYFVLVKNHDYSNLPRKVKIPKKDDLPPEVRKWLSSSKVVQKKRILIRLRAREMRFLTKNILRIARRIALFCRFHRYPIFYLQFLLGSYRSQDAFTALLINGECPGRSHLGVALFRANKIPARVLLANPNYTFWYEMHYMTEYYLPGYGWIPTEVHKGITPYEPKYQIILRVCHPEDENNTQHDFIYKKMKGLERWIWIDNEYVIPYYKDLVEGSKCKMFTEKELFTDKYLVEDAVNITKNVFDKYEYFLGMNLTGNNLGHFENATSYQFLAIDDLKNSEDVSGYINYLNKANDEYDEIVI